MNWSSFQDLKTIHIYTCAYTSMLKHMYTLTYAHVFIGMHSYSLLYERARTCTNKTHCMDVWFGFKSLGSVLCLFKYPQDFLLSQLCPSPLSLSFKMGTSQFPRNSWLNKTMETRFFPVDLRFAEKTFYNYT